MPETELLKRMTFTADKRYFIQAIAARSERQSGDHKVVVMTEVFFGHPKIYGNRNIHFIVEEAKTNDLLDALESGEAAARHYILTLPRRVF